MDLLLIIVLIAAVAITWIGARYYNKKKGIVKDRVINETNYNINMLDEARIEKMSPQEAKEWVNKLDQSDLSALSHRDFYALKEKIESA